jgi:hypothetical protein
MAIRQRSELPVTVPCCDFEGAFISSLDEFTYRTNAGPQMNVALQLESIDDREEGPRAVYRDSKAHLRN